MQQLCFPRGGCIINERVWNESIANQGLISCRYHCKAILTEFPSDHYGLSNWLCGDDLTFEDRLRSALPPFAKWLHTVFYTTCRCNMPCCITTSRCYPLDRQVQLQRFCGGRSNSFSPAENICPSTPIQNTTTVNCSQSLNILIDLPECKALHKCNCWCTKNRTTVHSSHTMEPGRLPDTQSSHQHLPQVEPLLLAFTSTVADWYCKLQSSGSTVAPCFRCCLIHSRSKQRNVVLLHETQISIGGESPQPHRAPSIWSLADQSRRFRVTWMPTLIPLGGLTVKELLRLQRFSTSRCRRSRFSSGCCRRSRCRVFNTDYCRLHGLEDLDIGDTRRDIRSKWRVQLTSQLGLPNRFNGGVTCTHLPCPLFPGNWQRHCLRLGSGPQSRRARGCHPLRSHRQTASFNQSDPRSHLARLFQRPLQHCPSTKSHHLWFLQGQLFDDGHVRNLKCWVRPRSSWGDSVICYLHTRRPFPDTHRQRDTVPVVDSPELP